MVTFTNASDMIKFMKALQMGPPKKVTKQMLEDGYPMPKLGSFIEATVKEKKWTRLERYMKVNGEKIRKRFPLEEKVSEGSATYRNGCVIEDMGNRYLFTTYTLYENRCVYNHMSTHSKKNYGLTSGFVNLFDMFNYFDGYGDGEEYIHQMLEEYSEYLKDPYTFWDTVE